jgi:hypothetical protein
MELNTCEIMYLIYNDVVTHVKINSTMKIKVNI